MYNNTNFNKQGNINMVRITKSTEAWERIKKGEILRTKRGERFVPNGKVDIDYTYFGKCFVYYGKVFGGWFTEETDNDYDIRIYEDNFDIEFPRVLNSYLEYELEPTKCFNEKMALAGRPCVTEHGCIAEIKFKYESGGEEFYVGIVHEPEKTISCEWCAKTLVASGHSSEQYKAWMSGRNILGMKIM